MPYIKETADLLGYYDESRHEGKTTFTLEECLETTGDPVRWPIRNREPRTPIESQKRAIIHERDGGICRICGTGGHLLTVDHIIPRSAFPADKLDIADRSDNLISACDPCNQHKSNYEYPQTKRLGVTAACWECANPQHDDPDWMDGGRPNTPHLAYCGRCGINRVPTINGWIL